MFFIHLVEFNGYFKFYFHFTGNCSNIVPHCKKKYNSIEKEIQGEKKKVIREREREEEKETERLQIARNIQVRLFKCRINSCCSTYFIKIS